MNTAGSILLATNEGDFRYMAGIYYPGNENKPEIVDSMIDRKEFWRVPGTAMTVCCIVLKNGFTVVGTASCVDVRNYNEELSKELSFSKARDEVFHYLAFAVLDEKYQNGQQ